MREHLKFGTIRNIEEFESLKRFAETFDHHVPDDVAHPIFTIERGEHMIGYFNVISYPIVSPALHPAVCTPRDFYEAIFFLKNHYCLHSINGKFRYGTGLMAIPDKLEPNMVSAIEHAGFKNTGKVLWQTTPS